MKLEGLTLEGLVPMRPMEGPPLPIFLELYWPWSGLAREPEERVYTPEEVSRGLGPAPPGYALAWSEAKGYYFVTEAEAERMRLEELGYPTPTPAPVPTKPVLYPTSASIYGRLKTSIDSAITLSELNDIVVDYKQWYAEGVLSPEDYQSLVNASREKRSNLSVGAPAPAPVPTPVPAPTDDLQRFRDFYHQDLVNHNWPYAAAEFLNRTTQSVDYRELKRIYDEIYLKYSTPSVPSPIKYTPEQVAGGIGVPPAGYVLAWSVAEGYHFAPESEVYVDYL